MLNNLLVISEMNRNSANARVNIGAGNINGANNPILQFNIWNITLPQNIGLKD
ncbi:hypothetical protein [Clostridium sp.]|uniref:hypothetical protein n=1 Tax=Clostridium sp. TaxID=1506 RepID=UPI0032175A44